MWDLRRSRSPHPDLTPASSIRTAATSARRRRLSSSTKRIGGPAVDPHGLDADKDGVACESLPCPCQAPVAGGAPPVDTSVDLVLTGPNKVKAGRPIAMRLNCPLETCDATAQATYRIPKAKASVARKAKTFKTARVSVPIQADSELSLRLGVVGKAKRQIKKAAKNKSVRRKTKVTLKATSTDAAGNTDTEKLRLKLKK